MLGRKDYTQAEVDFARGQVKEQLAAFRGLTKAVAGTPAAKKLAASEGVYFNSMLLALDRVFVHRLRGTTGKDGTPLNELEMLVESLMLNGGVLRGINVIRYIPESSVVGLKIGDTIAVNADEFEALAKGVLAELEEKYL